MRETFIYQNRTNRINLARFEVCKMANIEFGSIDKSHVLKSSLKGFYDILID